MLRLRPSEITLTPADVEETRRRMARKHPAVPSASLSSRTIRPMVHPPLGPRIRRGPERSRDDAIKPLGSIPILTPHQALHSSEDFNGEVNPDSRAESPADESEPTAPAPVVQLPFRPAPKEQTAASHAVSPVARITSRDSTETDMSPLPPKRNSGMSRFGRTRANTSEHLNESAIQSQLESSIDGFTEDVSVGARRARNITARSGQPPSVYPGFDLAEGQQFNASQRQPESRDADRGNSQSEETPPVQLRGYFISPERYTFREYGLMPHTEPRQPSGRSQPRIRTLSSSSDPSQPISALQFDTTRRTATGDMFWAAPPMRPSPTAEPRSSDAVEQLQRDRLRLSFDERLRSAHTRLETIQGRYPRYFGTPRAYLGEPVEAGANTDASRYASQRFSEASSSSSLPYSYYELPASRHSSSNRSHSGEQLPQSQYDGAAPSRNASRGAYYSIRPSQVRPTDEIGSRPRATRVSSFSSPDLMAAPGQHGLSPRPASPYTRGHSAQNSPRPSYGLVSPDDFDSGERDATSAAQRDLASPLDLLEHRAAMQLARMSTGRSADLSGTASGAASVFQYQVEDFDDMEPQHHRAPGSGSIRQQSGNSAHRRMQAAVRREREMQVAGPYTRHPGHASNHAPERQADRRALPGVRWNQHSSENMPVMLTSLPGGTPTSRTAQAQDRRTSFGRNPHARSPQDPSMRGGDMQLSPVPARFSMPHPSRPRDISNRAQGPSPYQPRARRSTMTHEHRDEFRSSSPISLYQGYRYGPGRRPSGMEHIGFARGFHQDEPEMFRQTLPRAYEPPHFYHEREVHVPAAVMNYRLSDQAIVAATQALASRRPPIPARVASRRVSAHQQNQENSGEVENELMREEMQVARMRYAEDGVGLDVMDETPPRVGRFERRMLES